MRLFVRPDAESATPNRNADSHIYTILPMISENEKYIFFLLLNQMAALPCANRSLDTYRTLCLMPTAEFRALLAGFRYLNIRDRANHTSIVVKIQELLSNF